MRSCVTFCECGIVIQYACHSEPPKGAKNLAATRARFALGAVQVSGGVFSVDDDGYRGMRIESQETLFSFSSLRVTIEPLGGSLEPTGDEVLSGSLFNP